MRLPRPGLGGVEARDKCRFARANADDSSRVPFATFVSTGASPPDPLDRTDLASSQRQPHVYPSNYRPDRPPLFPCAVRGKRMSAVMNATETDVETETKQMLKDGGVTVEYQRRKAKEMVKFFKQQAYDQAVEDSQVFGWTPKNEINNGRWTMFGLLVGMMTEYATGVDFIDQVKLTVSVLGIADIYD